MIGLLVAPQALMSEGLAMLASEMIFSHEEQHQWLCQHIYPDAGVEPLEKDAYQVVPLWMAVRSNAAHLLGEGGSDEEILRYLQQYLRLPDDYAAKEMTMQPKNSPRSSGHFERPMPLPITLARNYYSHGCKDLTAKPSSVAFYASRLFLRNSSTQSLWRVNKKI